MKQEDVIKTVSYDQQEILRSIMTLYCPNGFELDPTYSKGVFYKGCIPEPKYKTDLEPQVDGVWKFDCRTLPFPDASVSSICFDPPFVGGSVAGGKRGIIKSRFSYYKNIPVLWDMYRAALTEFYRVLSVGGVLVFKCQDSVESGKQYMSHVEVINSAVSSGFSVLDLFILVAGTRLIGSNCSVQQHARKYHSYFWVFGKGRK